MNSNDKLLNKYLNYDEKIDSMRQRIIETLAKNMDLYGLNLSTGLLYGTLFFEDHPMTLDEMVHALGMSKTSMSTGVRCLTDLGMVNKVWVKGKRKDHYEVEQDWYQNFIDYFAIKWRKAIDFNTQVLKRSMQEFIKLKNDENLPEKLLINIENNISRIENILEYYNWISRLIDSFESHEIFNTIPINNKNS